MKKTEMRTPKVYLAWEQQATMDADRTEKTDQGGCVLNGMPPDETAP